MQQMGRDRLASRTTRGALRIDELELARAGPGGPWQRARSEVEGGRAAHAARAAGAAGAVGESCGGRRGSAAVCSSSGPGSGRWRCPERLEHQCAVCRSRSPLKCKLCVVDAEAASCAYSGPRYCCRECQREDWKEHSRTAKAVGQHGSAQRNCTTKFSIYLYTLHVDIYSSCFGSSVTATSACRSSSASSTAPTIAHSTFVGSITSPRAPQRLGVLAR